MEIDSKQFVSVIWKSDNIKEFNQSTLEQLYKEKGEEKEKYIEKPFEV
jgi:hypothetical protein